MVNKERLAVYLKPEVKKQIVDYCNKLGLSQSQLATLLMLAGLNSFVRFIEPEKAVTPEMMEMILKSGVDFKGLVQPRN